ncbi:MAG: hypothetical protein AB7K24_14760 [Gemmataceae bacterium]
MNKLCVVGALLFGVLACLETDLRAARVDVAVVPQRVVPGNTATVQPVPLDWPEDNAPNIENDDIDGDPDLPTNYNVERIEEVAIPGPVLLPMPPVIVR